MDSIKFENRNVGGTVSQDAINALQAKAAEAIEKLEPVKEMVSNINKDEIYARLALSYVKTNKKELAQYNILKSIEIKNFIINKQIIFIILKS